MQKKIKISKQLDQEQNHSNEDHMEGDELGGGEGRMGEKIQGTGSISGGYKIGAI